ncbi:hypothetical protein HDU87_000043 [Geranomyces variabilis]|uniref:Uncharacterized protein n=1 Tax=Geranomyces variabilis TaxID=109894 RepID=A0AAD5TRX3_9FUNG|nr:hypothetical protein HDU87_000043 [Geranomyces variabilis]
MLEELQAENKLLRQRLAKTEAELEKRSIPESTFLGRLARNEQDVLALTAELQELGKLAHPDVEDTKRKLLDPTWMLLYKAMRREVDDKNKKIENLQREILGVGFNPNSITGKKIVSKLRALQTENEELGRQLCQGRVQQLQTALALELARREDLESQLRDAAATELELENENQELHAVAISLQSKLQRYEEAAAAAAFASAEISAQSGVT